MLQDDRIGMSAPLHDAAADGREFAEEVGAAEDVADQFLRAVAEKEDRQSPPRRRLASDRYSEARQQVGAAAGGDPITVDEHGSQRTHRAAARAEAPPHNCGRACARLGRAGRPIPTLLPDTDSVLLLQV